MADPFRRLAPTFLSGIRAPFPFRSDFGKNLLGRRGEPALPAALIRLSTVDHQGEHHTVDEGVEVAILFPRLDAEDGTVFIDSVVVDRRRSGDVVKVQHLVASSLPSTPLE